MIEKTPESNTVRSFINKNAFFTKSEKGEQIMVVNVKHLNRLEEELLKKWGIDQLPTRRK